MADKQEASTAEEIDQDLDEFIDKMKEKNKNYTYKDGLSEENWETSGRERDRNFWSWMIFCFNFCKTKRKEEEIENIPLFMTQTPEEGSDVSDSMAALQAMKYEDENPVARAECYKEEGNYEYKKKNFKKAIIAYTEGIKSKCDDDALNAILYTNRATANFLLGNNRSALNDAQAARKRKPDYMKAITRGAAACMELKLYKDTIQWCDEGLAIESDNEKLLSLRKESVAELKKIERNKRKEKATDKKQDAELNAILAAIKERNIQFEQPKTRQKNEDDEAEEVTNKFAKCNLRSFHPSGARVQLDANNKLYWPVMFYYPEYKESDFIGAFCEEHCFLDHFEVVFGSDAASWDEEAKYEPYMLETYFDDPSTGHLCFVENSAVLKKVLSDSRFLVRQGTPSFIILVKGSSFRNEFLKQHTVER